jgi:hypothetical protein
MVSDVQRRVIDAVRGGAPLVEIELRIIEPAYLGEDEKAALWLYADALRELRALESEPVLSGSWAASGD